MPSTAEYWDVDGESLNELTHNLRSWGGSREEPPPLRGSNETVPYTYGDLWVPKTPGSRQIVLDGWMVGPEQELRTRWRKFRSLLWRPEEQFRLTRRWLNEGGGLMEATGLAEYVSGMEPVMMAGGTRLEFKVTVRLSDPFFYSQPVVLTWATPGDKVVTILGDHPTKKLSARFSGMQSGSRLDVFRNAVLDNSLSYTAVPVNAVALVDAETWKATDTVLGSSTPSSWKVSHNGRHEWLRLPLTTTLIKYVRATGTGGASITYSPAWF